MNAPNQCLVGLRAYLSALNIRNKCKHPFFLVLRFDSCIGMLYDASAVKCPAVDDSAFLHMLQCTAKAGLGPPPMVTGLQGVFPPFVIALKGGHDEAHTCERTDCPVRLSSELSLPHANSLPSAYKLLCDRQLATMRKAYCRLHCSHREDEPHKAIIFTPSPAPLPVCTSCSAPHLALPPPAIDGPAAKAQKQASALLTSIDAMIGAADPLGLEDSAQGVVGREDQCPEEEWQHKLRILAEAMAMHCRTRCASEIIAFMHDEIDSGNKSTKMAAPSSAALGPHSDQHSHLHTSTSCPPDCTHGLLNCDHLLTQDGAMPSDMAMLNHSHSHYNWP